MDQISSLWILDSDRWLGFTIMASVPFSGFCASLLINGFRPFTQVLRRTVATNCKWHVQVVTLFLFYAGFSYAAYLGLLRRSLNPVWPWSPQDNRFIPPRQSQHYCLIVHTGLDIVSVLLPTISGCASRHCGLPRGQRSFLRSTPRPARLLVPAGPEDPSNDKRCPFQKLPHRDAL